MQTNINREQNRPDENNGPKSIKTNNNRKLETRSHTRKRHGNTKTIKIESHILHYWDQLSAKTRRTIN